jgi:hypothetical protein
MNGKLLLALLAVTLVCSVSINAPADDDLVKKAKSLDAQDFDKTLPAQPVEDWLRAHLPASYEVIWGEHITDCGESTGTATDKERDMPLCAEVEIREGEKVVGSLSLFVATQKRGLVRDGVEFYSGYLERHGMKYDFTRLSDILKIK